MWCIFVTVISNHQASAAPWVDYDRKETQNIDKSGRVEHIGHKYGLNAESAETNGDMIIEIANNGAKL